MSRPAKKVPYNGFYMFRNHIKNECRSNGKRMSEDDLTKYAGDLWEGLPETVKEEWKTRAKEQKMKSRSDTATKVLENYNRCPSPTSSVASGNDSSFYAAVRRRPKPHVVPKESVFQAWNDLDMRENPEKKRVNDRKSFEDAFCWKYADGKNDLKKQKFYLLSSSLLYFLSDGRRVPAEIACVEFTLESGVTNSYCVPVKVADIIDPEIKEKIKQISETSHRFLLQDLDVIGKSCTEISSRLIEMSHKRESSCPNFRFFILNSELNRTFSCLTYLIENSQLEQRYKSMTICDVATVDDLVYGLFKYYNVDYPKLVRKTTSSQSTDVVDFDYFQKLISGENFRRIVCEIHDAYDDAYCCLSQLYLTAEIIRSSVERKKFDIEYLTEFASNVDSLKLRYYVSPPSSLLTSPDEVVKEVEQILDDQFEEGEDDEETILKLINGLGDASIDSDSTMDSITVSVRDQREKRVNESDAGAGREEVLPPPSLEQEPFYTPMYGNAFARAPDTLSVQHLLPSGRRGFGRGTRLTAEGELIDRLTWLKRITSS